MRQAIKTARKLRQRNKAGTAPNIGARCRRRRTDVRRQRIAGTRVHLHQLQLVRIADGGRILGGQHRSRSTATYTTRIQRAIGIDNDPVVATGASHAGEVEPRKIAGGLHICQRQTRGAPGGPHTNCTQVVIARGTPVAIGNRSAIVPANQCTNTGTRAADHPARVALRHTGLVVADQATNIIGGPRHVAERIAVTD